MFYSEVDLVATEEHIRTQETNTANMIADIISTAHFGTEFVIFNSGTLRIDSVLPQGIITKEQIYRLLPFDDDIVQLKV